MQRQYKSLNTLFAQLGLPDDDSSIEQFISEHSPLSPDIPIQWAPWWTSAQASFLAEAIELDSDWAEVADELNILLH